jgi:hypothetical protein
MQIQSRRTPISVVTFLALALSFSFSGTARGQNQPSPYRYAQVPADRSRIGTPDFEVMEAQLRLAQAQQSNAIRNVGEQPVHPVAGKSREPQPQELAHPDAPDQSELLKNSKDPDFILKTFHTMWVDAREAQYFGSDQMKAALGRNKEFRELNIHIVDDPHVADVLLKVGYTFAWEYPFQLTHQNTTMVLVAGKGLGPFSGPLGAADVAREFVKAVKSARAEAVIDKKQIDKKQTDTKEETPKQDK